MSRSAGVFIVALALVSCDPPVTNPPPPANPPQVFLTIDDANTIGSAITGKVNVSGCKKVAGVEILQQNTRLLTLDFTSSPTTFSLPDSLFAALYSQLGIAASLTLKAKVVCDDARTNTSQPVGVKFFPIAQRFTSANGGQTVPDFFTAEGGLGGTANTFLGCARTNTGTTIVRVDTSGEVKAFVQAMPFECSLATQISELSASTGYRWIFEPKVGAFALDMRTFVPGKRILSTRIERIGVGKSGIAVVWVNEPGTQNRIQKLNPSATDTTNDWSQPFDFIMNSTPVVDEGLGRAVWVSRWEFDPGTRKAQIVPYKYNLDTGQLLNGLPVCANQPCSLLSQQYPTSDISEPIMQEGFFSENGDTFIIPAYSVSTSNQIQTTILNCSTVSGAICEGTSARWSSPVFTGSLRLVVPFSSNNMYAAIGPFGVWFLSAQDGRVLNLGEAAITPSGSQIVVGVQPGADSDFYVLTGPDLGATPSFASEIIAVDSPQTGEVWRLNYGSGESPLNGMHIGIDDARGVWLRVGTDLIKPRPNTEYRAARGATRVP